MNNVANFIDKIDLSSGVALGATSLTLVDFSALSVTLPTPPFTFVIWNSTDYSSPALDPAREVCVCSNNSSGTLTYTNAQEGTSNVAHNTSGKTYSICVPFTKGLYDALVTATTKSIVRELHFALDGEIKVASGSTDFIPIPKIVVPSGHTYSLYESYGKINEGTSVTYKVQRNGSDVTGFTSLSVGTSGTTTTPTAVTLANGDFVGPVVSAVSGTPKGGIISLRILDTF